jgi:excisionase family DNA binding protein
MEATPRYPNLLSEKQAAKRLGVARITLLRAREAGRVRFFRIGTRVLYCAGQLTEFLESCERNRHKAEGRGPERHLAKRKDNRVRRSRQSGSALKKATDSATGADDQASLPFSATR